MGKRGPKPTPLSDLIFWEGLWYWVFHHLRGTLPSAVKFSTDKRMKRLLEAELEELRQLVPKEITEEDWLARRRIDLERELHPKVPLAEPDIWRALVAARTSDEIRMACRQSKRWLNPRWEGKVYLQDLYDHAEKFIKAKKDVYYPKRESGDEKRVIFFARVMAGIGLEVSPHTSVDRLRKIKHGKKCPCISCDLARWDRIDRLRYDFLFGAKKRERRVR